MEASAETEVMVSKLFDARYRAARRRNSTNARQAEKLRKRRGRELLFVCSI